MLVGHSKPAVMLSGLSVTEVNSLLRISKPAFFQILLFVALSLLPGLLEAAEIEPLKLHKGRPNPDVIQGINHLYDLEFDEAERLFSKIVAEKPDYPVGYFYMAMVTWSRLSVGFWTAENLKEYVERIDLTISVAKKESRRTKRIAATTFTWEGLSVSKVASN